MMALLAAGLPAAPATALVNAEQVCEQAPPSEFDDAESIADAFAPLVDCLAAYGITQGDADNRYRPSDPVTRQQMALFVARFLAQSQSGTIDLPEPVDPADAFDDLVGLSPPEARGAINLLAEWGITQGATGGLSYRPGGLVTRGQMASFIARSLLAAGATLPVGDTVTFPDVAVDDTHAGNIHALAELGVVRGFADGSYGPTRPVTRQQMAQFLMLAAEVLAEDGLWGGLFLGIDPPAEAAVLVLGVDGDQRVVGEVITVTARLLDARGEPLADVGVELALIAGASRTSPLDPPDVEAAVRPTRPIGPDSPRTDEEGRVLLDIDTDGLEPDGYTVVVWAGEPGTAAPDDALAWASVVITLVAPPAAPLRYLDARVVELDGVTGMHVFASDGAAVSGFPATDADRYRLDDEPATRSAFLADAAAGDQLTVTMDGATRVFALSATEPPREGIVEVHDEVRFVDPASGVAISEDLTALLAGAIYTVDGDAASEPRFASNLSSGDWIRLGVADGDGVDNGVPSDERTVDLDNLEVRGEVVAWLDGVVVLDPNPDDVWTAGPGGLGDGLRVRLGPPDPDDVFRIGGVRVDYPELVEVIEDLLAPGGGVGTLTYDRRDGRATVRLTVGPPPPFTAVSGTVLDGELGGWDGDPPTVASLVIAVDDEVRTLGLSPDLEVRIDELLATRAQFRATVSVGDRFTCTQADRAGVCTSGGLQAGTLAGRVVFVDASHQELDLLLDGGAVLQGLDLAQRPFGVPGTTPQATVNGEAYDGTLAALLAALRDTNLVLNTVALQLDEGTEDTAFTWHFTGLPDQTLEALDPTPGPAG